MNGQAPHQHRSSSEETQGLGSGLRLGLTPHLSANIGVTVRIKWDPGYKTALSTAERDMFY